MTGPSQNNARGEAAAVARTANTGAIDLDALADAVARKVADQLVGRPAPRYLTVVQAADYTALSQDSIRALLAGGKLTALRPVAGRILIDKQELDALLRSSTRRPSRGRGQRRARLGADGGPGGANGQH
jgi:excisionase family DNA binding protein